MVAWSRASWALRGGAIAAGAALSLVLCAPLLQQRSAQMAPADVTAGSVVVLFAGAADAPRRLDALHALCTDPARPRRTAPLTVLVGDDDELDDATGRAWGPLLVDRVREANGPDCLAPRLVHARVRTTQEELDALDSALALEGTPPLRTVVFVTSPYHRARVELGARSRPTLARLDRRFLEVPIACDDVAPHTVLFEGLRIARDALGLSDLLGRRSLDAIRARTSWARPIGRR